MNYEQWNRAIIYYFFKQSEPDDIVFLQANEETLSEIAEVSEFNVEDPVHSLISAVRNKVVRAQHKISLSSIDPTNLWTNAENNEPPQVAFLALTVLAASRMESEKSVSARDYYIRLNEALFGRSIKGKPIGFDRCRFEVFWKHLQKWTRVQHDVELHLTIGPQTRRYVWFPISQCLISKHDRRNIRLFFQEANLKPGTHLAESQLLSQLHLWKSLTRLPAKIRKPIEQLAPETRLILRQVQSLLKTWDGEPPEDILRSGIPRRSVAVEVQLCFDLYGNIDHVRYWFRCRDAAPIPLEPNPLFIKSLNPLNEKWFEPVPDDYRSFWRLQNNLQLKSANSNPLRFRLEASDIWIFRRDTARDDGWLNQRNLLLHEEHIVVFRERLRSEVQIFLNQVCEESHVPQKIGVANSESGWQYIHAKPIALPRSPLMGYHVTTMDQIRLVGGLAVDRRSNSYLEVCLPEVVVPNLVASTDDSFYINGKALEVPSSRKIGLPAELTPGTYHLSYLDSRTTLRVVSPIRSTEHEKQTSAIKFDSTTKKTPIFEDCKITKISSESGLWLSGAKLFGEDIPEITWDNVHTKPQVHEEDSKLVPIAPAEIISSVVKAAIELRQHQVLIPERMGQAIKYLDQNPALLALVEKKLRDYHEMALSYADLCKEVGR